MKEDFIFNRKYIKASARHKSKYSWDKVIKDFYDVLKNVPVQKSEPWYSKENTVFDPITGLGQIVLEDKCHNLYEQIQFVNWYKYDSGYYSGFVGFLLSYTTMYFMIKNFSDDELSYLYITGMEYIDPWDEGIEAPEVLLNPEYTQNIKHSRVIEVVSYLLTQKIILVENDADGEMVDFSLEEYEESCDE